LITLRKKKKEIWPRIFNEKFDSNGLEYKVVIRGRLIGRFGGNWLKNIPDP
jgi:hypothetical protein